MEGWGDKKRLSQAHSLPAAVELIPLGPGGCISVLVGRPPRSPGAASPLQSSTSIKITMVVGRALVLSEGELSILMSNATNQTEENGPEYRTALCL